jgi:hypothetical protein
VDVERRRRVVHRREERQPLHVVPVQVREQHVSVELTGAECVAVGGQLVVAAVATPAAPSSVARETPTAAPRALNVPVGSGLSSFISSRGRPIARPSRGIGSNGVMPSPMLTTAPGEDTGSSSWYRHRPGARPAICAGPANGPRA